MELKLNEYILNGESVSGSNRTFMELKYIDAILERLTKWVLIVPLWNWNLQKWKMAAFRACSNRTFMELK